MIGSIPEHGMLEDHTCCALGLLSRTARAASLSISLSLVLFTPTSCSRGRDVQSALVAGARSLLLRRSGLLVWGACNTSIHTKWCKGGRCRHMAHTWQGEGGAHLVLAQPACTQGHTCTQMQCLMAKGACNTGDETVWQV